MGSSIRDLKVWQESVALAADVARAVRQSSRRETKALTDRVLVSAAELAEYVAEGYARYTNGEQRQMYRAAKRALFRLETQLAVLRGAELLTAPAHAELQGRIGAVHRVLAGYLVYLDRQQQDDRERSVTR